MRNIVLLLEYDGTDFIGWQIQPNGRTVQGEIEDAVAKILQKRIALVGAGRTDAGVHARGQVANFHTDSLLDLNKLLSGLNGVLPRDVAVLGVSEADHDFHARYSAKKRTYRYYISTRPTAVDRRYRWILNYCLSVEVMQTCASVISGTHDFTSFCTASSEYMNRNCSVYFSRWIQHDSLLIFEISADRFLHGMVRTLVGTMVDVGRGHSSTGDFEEILDARDRRVAGMASPAQGLFLEQIIY
jgi:tRNA pseudouridine38-40 synthase